jgi:hypothetical protein
MSVYGVIADIDMSLVQWTALLTTEQPRLYTHVTSAGARDSFILRNHIRSQHIVYKALRQ